jgi:hypothetical protein
MSVTTVETLIPPPLHLPRVGNFGMGALLILIVVITRDLSVTIKGRGANRLATQTGVDRSAGTGTLLRLLAVQAVAEAGAVPAASLRQTVMSAAVHLFSLT